MRTRGPRGTLPSPASTSSAGRPGEMLRPVTACCSTGSARGLAVSAIYQPLKHSRAAESPASEIGIMSGALIDAPAADNLIG